MTIENCKNFQVYSQLMFSSIQWFEHKVFFYTRYTELILKRVENSVGVHLWNNLSQHIKNRKGSTFDRLIQEYCPLSYNSYFE